MKQPRIRLWMIAVALLVYPAATSISEVSVGDGSRPSLVLMYLLSGGGGDPNPWPSVRQHIDALLMLNPAGSDGVNPDGFPSLGIDPLTGAPEVTWARYDGSDYEIVAARWEGDRWSDPAELTQNPIDDRAPALAYAPDGTARITYHGAGEVYYIERVPGGTWTAPETVGPGVESSVTGSTQQTLAYQASGADGTDVMAADRNGVWETSLVSTTNFDGLDGNGDLDVRLHATATEEWIDWEDGPDLLGWAKRLASGTWSAPAYEPIANVEDEESGRLRIRQAVHR